MADFTATFEAGVNGNAVTTSAGEASLTAWNQVVGTITYDTTHVSHGALSAKLAGANEFMRWDSLTADDSFGRIYLYATAFGGNTDVIDFDNAGVSCGYIGVGSGGNILTHDNGGGNANGSVAIGLNKWIRIEYHFTRSATVGLIEVKLFNTATSITPDETIGSTANRNTGSAVTRQYFGNGAVTGTWGSNFWLDDIVANATAYPGPVPGPGPLALPPVIYGRGAC